MLWNTSSAAKQKVEAGISAAGSCAFVDLWWESKLLYVSTFIIKFPIKYIELFQRGCFFRGKICIF